MNRRAFFSVFSAAAAAIALDPERALFVPGKKLISIPSPRIVEPPVFSLKRGDIITIHGYSGFNPRTGEETGKLQRFVVTQDITGREPRIDLRAVWPRRKNHVFRDAIRRLEYQDLFPERPTSPAVTAPSHPAARS